MKNLCPKCKEIVLTKMEYDGHMIGFCAKCWHVDGAQSQEEASQIIGKIATDLAEAQKFYLA